MFDGVITVVRESDLTFDLDPVLDWRQEESMEEPESGLVRNPRFITHGRLLRHLHAPDESVTLGHLR